MGRTVHTKTYMGIFTNNMWFYLLWSPLIVLLHPRVLYTYALLHAALTLEPRHTAPQKQQQHDQGIEERNEFPRSCSCYGTAG